jgi:HTH-type transcriptional regulator/antitoxin HigA
MELKPIRNENDHLSALSEIERHWDADEGTPQGDHLEVLVTLVEAYERAHFPIDVPDPA